MTKLRITFTDANGMTFHAIVIGYDVVALERRPQRKPTSRSNGVPNDCESLRLRLGVSDVWVS
jgi:hypothetical protein